MSPFIHQQRIPKMAKTIAFPLAGLLVTLRSVT
jgi:hypothetical protein